MFGKKVDKAIRYDEKLDTYYVQFNFNDSSKIRGFARLEDAQAYRDAVYHEKLAYKIMKDTKAIHDEEEKMIKSCVPYPINVISAIGLDYKTIDDVFLHFDVENIWYGLTCLTEREAVCVMQFYDAGMTLEEIGKGFGVSKQRVQQVIALALKKIFKFIWGYHIAEKIEEEKAYRRSLIEEFGKTAEYNEGLRAEFGPLVLKDIRKLGIEHLALPTRADRILEEAGINTIGDLYVHMQNGLLEGLPGLGKKTVQEIKKELDAIGLGDDSSEGE